MSGIESDELLMRRVQRMERDAMAALVRRHADSVMLFLRRCGLTSHSADEVFQEVFLAVWKNRATFQGYRSFRPWLMGIAVNQARLAYRRQRRRSKFAAVGDQPYFVDSAITPIDRLIQCETEALIEAALGQLPNSQREVVVMRLWNGMSYQEIARALRTAESTVRTHMSLGLRNLRKFLEPRLHCSDGR